MNFKHCASSIVFLAVLGICQGSLCELNRPYTDTQCYHEMCLNKISSQVEIELGAAFTYLTLGAMFDEPSHNYHGLAKFFYASASEEREHGIMMLDYLNLRGYPFSKNFTLALEGLGDDIPTELQKANGKASIGYKASLEKALAMEIGVTNTIQSVLTHCDLDFHAQDTFTDPIMDEQHGGIRKLQAAIKQLEHLEPSDGKASEEALAEYIFDRKILGGEILG